MMKLTIATTLAFALLGRTMACPSDTVILKFIDEYIVLNSQEFKHTLVGGLSSINYDPQSKLYYLLSDDGNARFYTAQIGFDQKGFKEIEFVDVHELLKPDGTPFVGSDKSSFGIDPEAIVYNPKTRELIWSSEGNRIIDETRKVLIDPAIYISSTDGNFISQLLLPSNLSMSLADRGTLEGLAFTHDFKTLYATMEEPLFEDGPRAALTETRSWVRIYEFDMASKKNVAQYAYKLEPIAYPPHPDDAFKMNGVSGVAAFDGKKLLAIERSYSTGHMGCTIKLFLLDLEVATDVKDEYTLKKHPPLKPVTKKLLLNMESIGIPIDSIEGVTFGPDFPNGNRSLIFISDNNFNGTQKTQFLLFEVISGN